jgi:glycosyltransferase involved in cell wall biosynthesis
MKISFIIPHLSHGSPGSFFRPYEMAKRLSQFQIDHSFYTPFEQDVKSYDDISIKKIPGFPENSTNKMYSIFRKLIYNSSLSRFVPYDSMVEKLSKKIVNGIERDQDSTDIFQGELIVGSLAAIKLAQKFNKKSIIDIHNIWAIELVEDGFLKETSSRFKELMKLEKYTIDNSDGIIVVNEYMKNFIIEKFDADSKKIVVVPPGGEHLLHGGLSTINSERFREKKIIYAGLVNKREHVDLFVESIPKIQEKSKNTHFVISQQGEEIQNIQKLCTTLSLKPFFYWNDSREEARNFFKTCYLGILPSNDNISRKLGTPLKLLEYMSLGLPVVANDVGSWCKEIQENHLGLLCSNDPADMAEKILTFVEDQTFYEKIQKNILNSIENRFNWNVILKEKLVPFYNKIYS